MKNQSREVPKTLQKILKADAVISSKLCMVVGKVIKPEKVKGILRALEISCNGLLWLGFWMVYIWFVWHRDLFQMQVNFFIALITDILIIAVGKAYFRRRRPPGHRVSRFSSMGPDAFSFPSGHVSRSFMVFLFFTYLFPVGGFWSTVILIWSISVSISRLLLHMHYLLDIAGGFVVAICNFFLVSWILISKETSDWLIEYITEERVDGGVQD